VTGAYTPGQTVGPFFGYSLPYPHGNELVPPGHPRAIRLHGTVRDGDGSPVPDALLEIWQPDAGGRLSREPGSRNRDGYTFTGWGRAPTDNAGRYTFTTVEPGPTEPARAAFIAVAVFARGLLDRLFTRVYPPPAGSRDDVALAADPLLTSLPPDRRRTLIAERDEHGLRFDVVLQGDGETVFLAHSGAARPGTPRLGTPGSGTPGSGTP
jgi:protocatechuate 3,4-dioxygenase, alpha subunit